VTAANHAWTPADGVDGAARAVWDSEPLPLSAARLRPPFPADALPGWVRDMVAGVAEFTQTPPDLAGCLALACLATAAGGRAVVEVRHLWREPMNLFTVVALPPGSRKSAVFNALTEPLLSAERALKENSAPFRAKAEVQAKAARAHAAETAKIAESTHASEHAEQAIADAVDAALAAEDITLTATPRLVADDVTPEAAASLLAEQGGRIAVLSAEGGIFGTLAGRYSGTPNLEVFLKGHAGDLLVVDRKGRPTEHIDHPALTLGLAVQPDVLADLAGVPGFRSRGLLARILYALPANTVGRRRIGAPAPSPDVIGAYSTNLRSLVLSLTDWTDPVVIPITEDANDAVLHLETLIEPRLDPDRGDLGAISEWASKHVGATMRIAGLLHLAANVRDGWTQPIEAATVDAAAQIGHYFLGHALAVFDLMGADPLINDARHVLDWFARTRTTRFTRRDAFTALKGNRFRKVSDLDPVLDVLDQHGHIRPLPTPPPKPGGGRPPSPVYEVHPLSAEPAQPAQPQWGRTR
jgi:hypothetical protein